uniref:Uncharacterized protein n=1 Tax=Oryza glumipatula TaxID=40148 RepID=A0A0D9Z115_9ORYZ
MPTSMDVVPAGPLHRASSAARRPCGQRPPQPTYSLPLTTTAVVAAHLGHRPPSPSMITTLVVHPHTGREVYSLPAMSVM